jgi:hypothetical protein
MGLKELVAKYLAAAGSFGAAVPLEAFGISRAETEKVFSVLDEDYQISRFFHFSEQGGASYSINGFPQTHVALDAAIESLL